jgi:hypothetical protein
MPIVTNGLAGYWHYKQGYGGGYWNNISPNSSGLYKGTLSGTSSGSNGIIFDGIDDKVTIPALSNHNTGIYEIEVFVSFPALLNSGAIVGGSAYGQTISILGIAVDFDNKTINSTFGGKSFNFIKDQIVKINLRFFNSTSTEHLYINDVFSGSFTRPNAFYSIVNIGTDSFYFGTANNSAFLNTKMKSVKIYNRHLTQAEREQNTAAGYDNIALVDEPVSSPPMVTITNQNRYVISQKDGFSMSTATFKFDKDIVEWKINLQGAGHDTGTLINYGNELSANTEIEAIVGWDDLSQEGQYRINIYGKDSDGNWTPYES